MKEEFEEFRDNYKRLETTHNNLDNEINDLQQEKETLEEKLNKFMDQKLNLEKSMEVIKELIQEVFNKNIKSYKNLINRGLDTIFYDRDYQFDIDVDNRGSKKTAKLKYRKKEEEWSDWRDLDDNAGGAIRSVIDLITRIFIIHKTDRRNFVLFDESLTELPDDYVDEVIAFLESLSEQLDFDFLMVSHDPRFINRAEKVYQIEDGEIEKV